MVSSRDFIGSLERGLQVIEAFDSASTLLSLSDVASRVGMTRAAARRFLLTLTELGYAKHDGRLFSLTPKVLRLSRSHLAGNPIFKIAQPVLDTIAGRTMESASAGVLAGADVLFVARATSPRPVSIHIAVGTRIPAFCSAMGKVLLGELSEAEVRELMEESQPQRLYTQACVAIDDILASARKAKEVGYATSIEELEPGLCSIAVPVRNSFGETMFSLGLSAPARRMGPEQMVENLLPELVTAADKIALMH